MSHWPIEYIILGGSLLMIFSILASRVAGSFGVPSMLIFILIGMLCGAEGPGGIFFDNAWFSQFFGIVALSIIIFAGGLQTKLSVIKPIIWPGVVLSSAGVLITAMLTGIFAYYVIKIPFLEALLLGAIVSSTDAAAVFSILGRGTKGLQEKLRPLLEFESGSNDPVAFMLTAGLILLITTPGSSPWIMIPILIKQALIGIALGYGMGKLIVYMLKSIRFDFEALYPVLTLALILFTYGLTSTLQGSGILALYLAGIIVGNSDINHKGSLIEFTDGISWLMQISMFIILGLLVFPSRLLPWMTHGALIAAFLIFIARPLSVFAGLSFFKTPVREKLLVSWVGLRGAVAIILATMPMLAGVHSGDLIFNMVFFIVLFSVFLQGMSLPYISALIENCPVPFRKKPTESQES